MRRGMPILCALSALSLPLVAIDNAHFYNSPRYHGFLTTGQWEGDKLYDTAPWLCKALVEVHHGSATSSWDNNGNETTLLGLFGPQEMLYLTEGAPRRPGHLNAYEQLGAALTPAMQSRRK